jgi:hypothetical protein
MSRFLSVLCRIRWYAYASKKCWEINLVISFVAKVPSIGRPIGIIAWSMNNFGEFIVLVLSNNRTTPEQPNVCYEYVTCSSESTVVGLCDRSYTYVLFT